MIAFGDRMVLVTGAGGFVGAAVVRELAAHGARLRAWLGPAAAAQLAAPPAGVEVAYGDIADGAVLAQLVAGVECVFHAAGPPSAAASFAAPAEYLRIHAVGTARLLEACLAAGVPRVVYVSSAEVYGPADAPVTEDRPCAPRSPYGSAKLAAEQCLASCGRDMTITIVRPFSIFGPRAPAHSLVASLVTAAQRGEPVRVADPRPVRDYCYIDDVARGIVRAGARRGAGVRIYNLASGRGIAVADVARAVVRAAGRSDHIVDEVAADRPAVALTLALVGDPARAYEELGFRAETTLEIGLQRMLQECV
jgi:nucleoside-diphosphate-sugar epimerase